MKKLFSLLTLAALFCALSIGPALAADMSKDDGMAKKESMDQGGKGMMQDGDKMKSDGAKGGGMMKNAPEKQGGDGMMKSNSKNM